jgi:hypothetical protein
MTEGLTHCKKRLRGAAYVVRPAQDKALNNEAADAEEEVFDGKCGRPRRRGLWCSYQAKLWRVRDNIGLDGMEMGGFTDN